MTNIELLAKIKAEIERRIEAIAKAPSDNGVMDSINGARGHELMKLLSFLDTLESEKPMQEGLEEEIAGMYQALFGTDIINRKEMLYLDTFEAIARHFAEWGAEHAKKDEIPVPADLEEAAEELAWEKADIKFGKVDPNGCGIAHYWYREGFKDGCVSGASWQKEQDNTISRQAEAERIKTQQMCYEKGQADMKRQMMQEAVDAKIYGYGDGSYELIASWLDLPKGGIYKDGDKVRVIVCKKED